MVEIIPYQERWPLEFNQLARIIRDGLGGLALRIDHIGSTAVPGLDAKDIIDIQITVGTLEPSVTVVMEALGYSQYPGMAMDHCPPTLTDSPEQWEKWFFYEPPGQRPTNTHVRVLGRSNQRYALLSRDYLRAHPATAGAYARLKRQLAAHLQDSLTYSDVKDPAVDLIYFAAEAWAKEVRWEAGPSDA